MLSKYVLWPYRGKMCWTCGVLPEGKYYFSSCSNSSSLFFYIHNWFCNYDGKECCTRYDDDTFFGLVIGVVFAVNPSVVHSKHCCYQLAFISIGFVSHSLISQVKGDLMSNIFSCLISPVYSLSPRTQWTVYRVGFYWPMYLWSFIIITFVSIEGVICSSIRDPSRQHKGHIVLSTVNYRCNDGRLVENPPSQMVSQLVI